ncbi:hypothetical protein ABIE13_005409 [Ottowia thiooxydans]|uniref:Uncharacterized protein n=1 Tax=Ottowia thiooxydans TaxID=219182 RepID=A0ABV2QGV7_9BURK
MNGLKKRHGAFMAMVILAVPIGVFAQDQAPKLASEVGVPDMVDGRPLLNRVKIADGAPNERPRLASEQDLPTAQSRVQASEAARRGAGASTERIPLASEIDLPRRN